MAQVVVKRFFGKKRGNRNMRSDKLGGASLGIFFAVFFAFGIGALAVMLHDLTIPEWRAWYAFQPVECQVLDKRLERIDSGNRIGCRPEIHIAYRIDDVDYNLWTFDIVPTHTGDEAWCRAELAKFAVGEQRICWYDPQDPAQAVVVREQRWFPWLVLVLPASFLVIGGGGLVYTLLNWGKSTERRAVWARRASELDPLESIVDTNEQFPNVPGYAHLTNSPGTTLRYRLPPSSPSWPLLGMFAATIAWNALVAVLIAVAVGRHLAARPDWTFTGILLPFAAVGVVLIVFSSRRFLAAAEIGSTIVEIDQHPLYPGGKYKLFFSQRCRTPLVALRVLLACDEEVRYLQGTNLRIARQRVAEIELYATESFADNADVPRDQVPPHTARFSFEVPTSAMHSFSSNHNHVVWKLLVEGRLKSGRGFERGYQLNVYPRGNDRNSMPLRAAGSEHA